MLRFIASIILSVLAATNLFGASLSKHDSEITISRVPLLDRFPSKCII